jgi:hypothetical protein
MSGGTIKNNRWHGIAINDGNINCTLNISGGTISNISEAGVGRDASNRNVTESYGCFK